MPCFPTHITADNMRSGEGDSLAFLAHTNQELEHLLDYILAHGLDVNPAFKFALKCLID